MVTYGDGLADVDIRRPAGVPPLARQARHRHGRPARPRGSASSTLDDDGRVAAFAEKPRLDGWANAGFFVFDRRVFDYLDGDDCILEREPLERLAAEGELMAYRHDGFFYAMDTYREYKLLNELWDRGKAPWKVWGDGDGRMPSGGIGPTLVTGAHRPGRRLARPPAARRRGRRRLPGPRLGAAEPSWSAAA